MILPWSLVLVLSHSPALAGTSLASNHDATLLLDLSTAAFRERGVMGEKGSRGDNVLESFCSCFLFLGVSGSRKETYEEMMSVLVALCVVILDIQ